MKRQELRKRMEELRARQADVWLPTDIFDPLCRLVRGAGSHYKNIDVSILDLTAKRLAELRGLLDAAKPVKDGVSLHLSSLDMMELRQVSGYAERFLLDYGDTGLTQNDVIALTAKLDKCRKSAFPDD